MAGLYAQQQYAKQVSEGIPQYGGDCALKEEGLASALTRLEETTNRVVSLSWDLRDIFGLTVPECGPECGQKGEPMSGPKAAIDRSMERARVTVNNLEVVLEHLRS